MKKQNRRSSIFGGTFVFLTSVSVGLSANADFVSDIAAVDIDLKSCIARDSSNSAMKECTQNAKDSAEKALTAVYRDIVERYKSDTSKDSIRRIVASERAWISYRGAQCRMEGLTMSGGSGEGLVIVSCELRMTEERVKILQGFLRDSDG